MDNYITLTEAAKKMGISTRRLRTLCETKRIDGATKFGRNWAIPITAEKPNDNRVRSDKYKKTRRDGKIDGK